MATEIERKYLVAEVPHASKWPRDVIESSYDDIIVQTYLYPAEEGSTERVRSRKHKGKITYTHTIKKRISDGVNEENERIVSANEYKELLTHMDMDTQQIRKIRRVFQWGRHTFELDTFLDPLAPIVLLEVELQSEWEPVMMPPFLPIIRDVTGERDYSNAVLSRRIL